MNSAHFQHICSNRPQQSDLTDRSYEKRRHLVVLVNKPAKLNSSQQKEFVGYKKIAVKQNMKLLLDVFTRTVCRQYSVFVIDSLCLVVTFLFDSL